MESRRKLVTVLFCDVVGSTALGEELDPEALQSVLGRYFEELRAAVERHGGTVEKFIGDALVAVFGIPVVREDDALRAVRAAVEIRQRVPAVAEEVGLALSLRTGVNTGVVLAGGGENLALGDAVNVAARLEQAAAPGEILLGEETLRLVRDAVQVEPLTPLVLKGKSLPVEAYRLLDVDPLAPALARHLELSLVGREYELGSLRAAWDRTVEGACCQLLTLVGVAGVGKSRLVAELLSLVGDEATVLSGRCLHYGEGITFWPLLEALVSVGEPARGVRDRLGRGSAAIPEELFFEVRRLLESLALERPVIVHIDDLQWAEPMLLDLLEHITTLSRGAPILILGGARPELLERRPAWGGGTPNATTLRLEPLDADQCERLLDQLDDGLAPEARARAIAASEGNPLFLEEMAALSRERGTFAIPSTIQTLLAARLEQLGSEERQVLERAAMEGEVFHRSAVHALVDQHLTISLDSHLAALVSKQLIRPHQPTFKRDQAFRFRHLLIRDAAYDALPKATRAELHAHFADWLELNVTDLAEVDEISGWHLEQTIRYRQQLRRQPEAGLARRAAHHLHRAGQRAAGRADTNAAGSLLERAHALVSEDDSLRAQISIELAEQLLEGGDLARVDTLLSAAEQHDETAAAAELVRLRWCFLAGTDAERRAGEERLGRLIEALARTGNQHLLAKAHFTAVWPNSLACRWAAVNEQARMAAEYARAAGDDGLYARATVWIVAALVVGPQDAATVARQLDELEAEQLGPYVEAFVVGARGELARLRGDFSQGRRLIYQAVGRCQGLGSHVMAAGWYPQLANLEIQAGNPSAALAGLSESDAILAELGERGFRSSTQAMIGQVQVVLGDHSAAQRAIELSDELGDPEDVVNRAITHAVRAHLALAAGDGARAERWARSAVEGAARMDNIFVHGHTRLELARVLDQLGQAPEASKQVHTALALFEAKGDQPSIQEAQALLKTSFTCAPYGSA